MHYAPGERGPSSEQRPPPVRSALVLVLSVSRRLPALRAPDRVSSLENAARGFFHFCIFWYIYRHRHESTPPVDNTTRERLVCVWSAWSRAPPTMQRLRARTQGLAAPPCAVPTGAACCAAGHPHWATITIRLRFCMIAPQQQRTRPAGPSWPSRVCWDHTAAAVSAAPAPPARALGTARPS